MTAVVSLVITSHLPASAETRLTVNVNQPGVAVSPTLHGAFFEDVNYGADGGLYAELVQNRSFEHRERTVTWQTINRNGQGDFKIETAEPLNSKNPHYARLQVRAAGQGFGLANEGFGGIAVKKDESYRFSVHARGDKAFQGTLVVILEDEQGRILGQARIDRLPLQWKKFEQLIKSQGTVEKARLVLLATTPGRVDLDMVSLFPVNTWKQRPNGLRADIVKMLADMKPGFMRFPGGCIVEGKDLSNAYRWKDTIGDVATRPQNWNRWAESGAPHYSQTYGLGFYEYFQLCEDIGAEPVPVVNAGMACQFQTGQCVPLSELGPWVQDALDLIEFANGPVTSPWGAKRAAMGHRAPFNMKYLAIGNEQWGPQYFERYKVFYAAIKAKYPHIQLISTSGPGVDDQWWNLAWNEFKAGTPAQIVDEHYYRPPHWFLQQSDRYDRYDRKGPKVFAGEYAAHTAGRRNNFSAALAEAAFMTGLVRNADIVHMASYAPLFAKAGYTQWTPNLIWFDNARVYGSPSYYVQSMFARNCPDVVLPVNTSSSQQDATFPGMVGVATWNTEAEFKDIRVTKDGNTLFAGDFSKGLEGWKTSGGKWEIVDNALRQIQAIEGPRAIVGDVAWSDYTYSLKARKLGGREGFLIMFQSPGDETKSWWNLGGWNNTQHGIELPGVDVRIPGRIETNRWYDIRIELKGATIKCFLDGKLVQEITRPVVKSLYVVAGRKQDEVIVKVVNVSAQPQQTTIDLQGAGRIESSGKAIVLTASNPDDENSFATPTKVLPVERTLTGITANLRHVFPPQSVTILRLKAASRPIADASIKASKASLAGSPPNVNSQKNDTNMRLRQNPVAPQQVHHLGGFVGERWQANLDGSLKKFDINRYVRMVEEPRYRDWFWIGEHPGKWLESSIISSTFAKDPALETQARGILARMVKSQEPGGYVGITDPAVRTSQKPIRGIEAYEHYWTLHALLTAWEVWGDRSALEAAKKLGDYYLTHIGPGKAEFWPSPIRPPHNQRTQITAQAAWVPPGTPKAPQLHDFSDIAGHTAHYSWEGTLILDAILRLHQTTGDKRFLDWSQWVVGRIDTWSGWDAFSRLDDVAAGKIGVHELQPYVHSHTFQLNFLAFLRLYQITGDESYLRKVVGAWEDISRRQLYITGGVSVAEHYEPGYHRPVEGHVVETCANMSWMQLNQALLQVTGDPRYAEVQERLLLNHVFASQTVDGDSYRYHTPPNGLKPVEYFHGPDCCTSSGHLLVSQLPRFFYAQEKSALIVNQYVPSSIDFKLEGGANVTLTQETRYPEEETVIIHVKPNVPGRFTVKLRMPSWCKNPDAQVNGVPVKGAQPGTYLEITRSWKAGDKVTLRLPMTVQWVEHDHLPTERARWALMRGPVVYAVDTLWWDVKNLPAPLQVGRSVALASQEKTAPRSERVPAGVLGPAYRAALQTTSGTTIEPLFVPFANVGRWYRDPARKPDPHSAAYSYAVWLADSQTPEFAAIVRATQPPPGSIDFVQIGDAVSEKAHNLQGESSSGPFQDRIYRHSPRQFSYDLKVSTEAPSAVVVTYHGSDIGREFDIFINDRKIATQQLKGEKPDGYIDVRYAIPFDLIHNKTDSLGRKINTVTVKFVNRIGSPFAGGIFALWTEMAKP
ncbi:MAG TPA: beta-L-arabinofuranosidase domain-containing protein [Abditibacteriaceae bacterium]